MCKKIYMVLVIVWMIIIFLLSNQPAVASTELSDGFISTTIGNIYKLFDSNVSDEKLDIIKDKCTVPVRKMAHFTIYMILGLFVTLLIKEYNFNGKQIVLISLLICFIYSISDEVHQLFVFGRSGEITDVFIDTCGSLIGIVFTNRIVKK